MLRSTLFRTLVRPIGRAGTSRAALVAAALALPTGCTRSGSAHDAPNVLFISIDTLRADHVGCYGHADASTPNIDRLAAEGTRFAMCISSCPLTLPSHSTMMTGTYPFVHGARVNLVFELAPENLTLAEVLREAGYETWAEVGATVLDRRFGLAQGFDGYGQSGGEDMTAAQRMAATRDDRSHHERPANTVTDAALAYLDARRADSPPFFLFAHYFDPHQPYEAPQPFASTAGDGYLAEIAYTDSEVGRLLDGLRARGLADRTLVLVTSDHGEGLGEHGEPTHGAFLYDSTLHVPLVVRLPGGSRAGQVVASQVGLVDLFPTILGLAGVEVPAGIQGTSLVPLLHEPQRDLALSTYAETLEPRMTFGYAELRALRHAGWKYIHGPLPELYETARDPAEVEDRAASEAERSARMSASLRDLIARAPTLHGRGSGLALDPEDARRLAALGYASADGPQTDEGDPHLWFDELEHFETRGPSPGEHREDMLLFYNGLGTLRDGDHGAAVVHWTGYVERNPEHAAAHSFLAQALALAGREDEALPALRRALELDSARCSDHQILASMLARAARLDEAREHFERALECDGEDALAALNLGKVLELLGESEAALAALDTSIALEPGYAPSHARRAGVLHRLGRDDEAQASARRAVEIEPGEVGHRLELATLLADTGQNEAAEAVYLDALRSLPADTSVRAGAARFWIARGEGARALEVLEAGLRSGPGAVSLAALRLRLLATDPDPEVRAAERALRIAERLLAGGHADDPRILAAAAAAVAASGDFERAIALAERALEGARARDARHLAERTGADLADYRAGRPAR